MVFKLKPWFYANTDTKLTPKLKREGLYDAYKKKFTMEQRQYIQRKNELESKLPAAKRAELQRDRREQNRQI